MHNAPIIALARAFRYNRRMSIEARLIKLGLTDKEARVYRAALELGPGSAQKVAAAAGINRPTAYVLLENLIRRGLMSSVEEGGRRLFVAEDPGALTNLYREQAMRLAEVEVEVGELVPELRALAPRGDRPRVRLFEGWHGLETMRQELLKMKKIEFCTILGDDYISNVPEPLRKKQLERFLGRGVRAKVILAGKQVTALAPELKLSFERYGVPPDKYPSPGELAVFGDKVALLSYKKEPVGVIIEHAGLAQVARTLFQLAFERARLFKRLDRE